MRVQAVNVFTISLVDFRLSGTKFWPLRGQKVAVPTCFWGGNQKPGSTLPIRATPNIHLLATGWALWADEWQLWANKVFGLGCHQLLQTDVNFLTLLEVGGVRSLMQLGFFWGFWGFFPWRCHFPAVPLQGHSLLLCILYPNFLHIKMSMS